MAYLECSSCDLEPPTSRQDMQPLTSNLLIRKQLFAAVEAGVTLCTRRTGPLRGLPAWCSSMVVSTRPITPTNPMGWLRRAQRCGRSWYAATFRSMEVCWRAMALSRDCLRMRVVADTGDGAVVAAIHPHICLPRGVQPRESQR